MIERKIKVSIEEEPKTLSSTCIEYIGSARLRMFMIELNIKQ
jgi:hypothetical protein